MRGSAGKLLSRAGIIVFWLLVWQGLSLCLHNSILLSGPFEAAAYLEEHIFAISFWKTVGNSFLHIFAGFMLAFITGVFLGVLSAGHLLLEKFLSPLLQFMKAVPVASFVVLLLIFTGSEKLSISVTFLMALPIIYQNVLEGVRNTDAELLEMAQIFRMPLRNRIFFIYRPSFMPFLISGSKVALGMSFKAGVAAEVIGTPDFSIGERIYMSKIYLDTAGLFAWTFVVIALSFLFEKGFLLLLALLGNAKIKPVPLKICTDEKKENSGDIVISSLSKHYGEKHIFTNINHIFSAGRIHALMGKSGCGKTTLFRIFLGLTDFEQGNIAVPRERCGVVFQENRLCEKETPVRNISMVAAKGRTEEEIKSVLSEILPEECLGQPVEQLSGGMKRRTAIARALLCDSGWLLLDEPFTGLDEETKKRTIDFILRYRNKRTMIVATHQIEEVEKLSAQLVQWDQIGEESDG